MMRLTEDEQAMVRGEAGFEEEFELFMQLLGTYCGVVELSYRRVWITSR